MDEWIGGEEYWPLRGMEARPHPDLLPQEKEPVLDTYRLVRNYPGSPACLRSAARWGQRALPSRLHMNACFALAAHEPMILGDQKSLPRMRGLSLL